MNQQDKKFLDPASGNRGGCRRDGGGTAFRCSGEEQRFSQTRSRRVECPMFQ